MRQVKFRVWEVEHNCMSDLLSFNCIDEILSSELNNKFAPMQFTGLHDKNGKEIYEGDVVRVEGYKNMQVKWNDSLACFGIAFERGATSSIPSDVEVIGNIYQNPELLQNRLT